mgnify:CR=1 FL=1
MDFLFWGNRLRVLFAGGCVVQITYESFLDFGFSEFFMLYRTANSSSLYFS